MEIEVRVNGALEVWYKKGDKFYYHREDGPAFIRHSDKKELWYYYNKQYYPKYMPLNLFIAYCKWEYKKNG